MNYLNLNNILNRENEENQLIDFLNSENQKSIYVYGELGIGKSFFVKKILQKLQYEIIDLETINLKSDSFSSICYSQNNQNVLNNFLKKKQKNILFIDSLETTFSNDKNIITQIIKILKNKKKNHCSILFIGNNLYNDKKYNDIIKNSHIIHLKPIPKENIFTLLELLMPTLEKKIIGGIYDYTFDNLFKINHIYHLYKNKHTISFPLLENFYKNKTKSENTKLITKDLLENYYPLQNHNSLVYETDRTIVSLLWHENIIDLFKQNKLINLIIYKNILQNICYGDYLDRVTFQKQIWIFNEMSFLIKTMYNNFILHKKYSFPISKIEEVRFTKVLTKYSTEFNNYLFIQNLCLTLNMDKKDLFSYFLYLKKIFKEVDIVNLLIDFEISKLDIQRIYRYLDVEN